MPDLALAPMALTGRCVRISLRQLDALITALVLPVLLMLMFVGLFGGAIDVGTRYVQYVVPGVIVLCAGFGGATTAVSVAQDMRSGMVDRLRAMDVGGRAILAGHVAASVVRNLVTTAVVIGVALAIGFRPHAGVGEWAAAAGVLVAFMIAVSWLAAAIGLLARSPEAANGFSFLVSFLPYPSAAFVPVATMPAWIQGFAGAQPVTKIVESLRELLLGAPGASTGAALAWCAGIAMASIVAAGVLFRVRAG
jgi:ABC-2 type transport system permease protein